MLGGSGGMLPRENFDKNGSVLCNLGVPKYVITILKINTFQQQQNLIAIFFSQINVEVHAIQ